MPAQKEIAVEGAYGAVCMVVCSICVIAPLAVQGVVMAQRSIHVLVLSLIWGQIYICLGPDFPPGRKLFAPMHKNQFQMPKK